MHSYLSDCLADLSAPHITRLRLVSMLAVLVVGLVSGYLASSRFGLPEHLAKKIMTIVLVCFNWLIALLVIWPMQLSRQLVWLPILGALLALIITGISAGLFSLLKLGHKNRLTLILAGALSNMGYTGGSFVCYALFGTAGLALANIYCLFWFPLVGLVLFPLLKLYEIRRNNAKGGLSIADMLDVRLIAFPASILAIVLNLADIEPPALIAKFHLVDILVYTASAMAFFAIGLQVNLSRLKNYINLYFPLAAVKFILTPAVALAIIWILALTGQDLTGLFRKVIIVLSACPSAVLMVTISNVFDLDSPLASALWLATNGFFVAVIVPVLFFIFT